MDLTTPKKVKEKSLSRLRRRCLACASCTAATLRSQSGNPYLTAMTSYIEPGS